ncbi:uncharacterized protein LOC111312251 isoform X2 [Durio zibethinus]|uniref:Uncharacterized protein LOC111312251 isoform X2 n=1 Tax=Durio zibethinus TaxID=66656 RepID=A0A6P6ATC8_DURZI|nr:uncharacterized protein LOC111312251 isoform X2 [Durio zibethinus]
MGKLKNVTCYDEVAEMLEDLRLDSLKNCGMLESFRPSYGSNSKGGEKEIIENCKEIDMEEYSRYEMFLSDPEQFGYLHDDDDEEDMKNDPEYKIFYENIKEDEDGESYLVEIPMSSGISLILKYEEKEEGSSGNVDRKRNFKSHSKRVKVKDPENLGGFSRKADTETPKTVKKTSEIGNEGSKNKLRDVPGEERKSPVDEKEVKEEADVDSVPYKSSGEPSKKMNWVMMDSLEKPGKNMELSYESDHTSIHLKNDGSCSDLEIFVLDNMPFHEGDISPFVPSKCYQSLHGEESWDGIRTSSQSQFREKLMDLLKIPYDRQEFENLWREVTCRKPVQRVKELRYGRMKSYSTKTNGKSYLDWYEELRMKIDEFRHDRQKILYLLRGFFFWLEVTNVCIKLLC